MPRKRLRPQAKRTKRRTATGCIKRHVRMEQERNVVFLDSEVAFVNLGRERQLIETFCLKLRSRRVQMNAAIASITRTRNLTERLALRVLDDGMVEFARDDEIDFGAGPQTVRLELNVRAHECDLQVRLRLFHLPHESNIVIEPDSRCEQNKKIVIAPDSDRLFRSDAVRRSVQ